MIEITAKITANKQVAEGIFLLHIESSEIALNAKPGQFIMLSAGSLGYDPLLRRPFSICYINDHKIAVLYRVVGHGTDLLTKKCEGQYLSVLGPLGTPFDISSIKQGGIVMIAGGMGVAPICFLAQRLKSYNKKFLIMTGFSTLTEIPRLDYMDFMGIKIATDDGSLGYHGFVTDMLEDYLTTNEKPEAIYTCGPLPMMSKVAGVARHYGIPCQVSMESNMACGLGACQGCSVCGSDKKYKLVCKNGPVFKAEDICWSKNGKS